MLADEAHTLIVGQPDVCSASAEASEAPLRRAPSSTIYFPAPHARDDPDEDD